MNVIKMRGGLGNQMFQYAFGKVLHLLGRMVTYDTSWYTPRRTEQSQYPRPFRLDKFQVNTLLIRPFIKENPVIYEKRVGYNLQLFSMQNDNNFDGYWQYYDYYQDILSVLTEEFQLRTEFYTEEFMKMAERVWGCASSISVHVRRGDYLLQRKGGYGDLSAKYYFSAIQQVKGDLFIFSDDIDWCKTVFKQVYFPNRKVTFVDMADYLCFELMRFCQHNIISNSTFSWWAALLNPYKEKKVIRPKHYLGASERDSDLLHYPKEWIKTEDFA